MDVIMFSMDAVIEVRVKHHPKEAQLHRDFDMWSLKLKRGSDAITINFRDLDELVDMTKSLALRVTELRVEQEQLDRRCPA